MSGSALKDLNVLQVSGLEKRSDCSSKGGFTKPDIENTSEILDMRQTKVSPSLAPMVKDNDFGANGMEVGILEVEYIESENLLDLSSLDANLSTLLERLTSNDWVLVCEALNNVRQLSLYHKEKLLRILGDVIPLIVKSLKSPRSAVCKTAIMTSADIFKVYGDSVIDSLDPMILQLLLKSSQDKRFVCEAAEIALIAMKTWVSPSLLLPKLLPYLKNKNPRIRAKTSMCFSRSVLRLILQLLLKSSQDKRFVCETAEIALIAMTTWVSPFLLLPKLLPYHKNKNPRIRAKTSMCFSRSVLQLGMQGIQDYGIDKLIQIAATQLSDRLPESREAARNLALELKSNYQESQASSTREEEELEKVTDSWEAFCQAKLSPLSALAILRVTSPPKEGPVVDC